MYCRSTWVAAEFAVSCPINRHNLFVGNNGAQIVEKAGQDREHPLIALNAAGR